MTPLPNVECDIAELDGRLVGTVTLSDAAHTRGTPWYDRPDVASFGRNWLSILPNTLRIYCGRVSGMRPGELRTLRKDRVDFERRMVNLHIEDTKDRRSRSFVVSDDTFWEILAKRTRHVALAAQNSISKQMKPLLT